MMTNLDDKKVTEILLAGDYVASEDIEKGKEFARLHHSSLLEYLVTAGLITNDILGQAIAESFGVSYGDLNSNQPSREQVLKIPEDIAVRYHVVLFKEEEGRVTVATDSPEESHLRGELEKIFPGKEIVVVYSLTDDILAALVHYRKTLETRFAKIIAGEKRVAPEIIEEIFEDALAYRASDIHFEPQEKEVVIRFRVDGVLHEAGRIPKEYYENILNRVKVQSRLRIDEHFSAQDGALRYPRSDRVVDMRVSVVPTLDGEKIAIRILAEYVRAFTLADLGLSPHDQELILAASKKPFGMILVTGPTGSGKTTTLYALLKLLNRPEVNITTIEDPVEYKIVGVNQIQVNPQTNLTFAHGLRSIIRQDPNIILVGEIRDRETAEIAVNAALTGHLLLSTFHANDAATAIPRLLDMAVEPFLLASTLELVIAQRLVRRICESCRVSYEEEQSNLERIFRGAPHYFPHRTVTLYRGQGCTACSGSGFRGRTAVFEFIPITRELQDLILKNPTSREIGELARKEGAHSLFEDGIEKVKNGLTTLEELLRVAVPPHKGEV